MTNHFDVMIVGAGLVGLTAALFLAENTSLSICLVDASLAEPHASRVSAITLASKTLLNQLNVWQKITDAGVGYFEKMHVFTDKTQLNFDSSDIAQSCLGYIVKNHSIHTALTERASTFSNLKIVRPLCLTSLTEKDDCVLLHAEDGRQFSATLLIAADGARSWVREKTRIQIEKKEYLQSAIVATIHSEKPHQHIARQWFEKNNILAFLPLKDPHAVSIVWSLPTDLALTYYHFSSEKFLSQLHTDSEQRLGELKSVSDRHLHPLCFQKAEHYIKNRIALVGDAAHVVHPLAGLGVNMGFQDVATLCALITEAHQTSLDFSSHQLLRQYERSRKAGNQPFLFGIDCVKTFFSASGGHASMKNKCMNLVERSAMMKRFFMQAATF